MILDYILDYGSRKTACRADLRKLKCTKNPLRVYTESILGVHQIHFGCTRNPSQVYTESILGVHGIHLRCTSNPLRVYTESISGVQEIHSFCCFILFFNILSTFFQQYVLIPHCYGKFAKQPIC